MEEIIKAAWIGIFSDAIYKFFVSVVRSKEYGEDFYSLGVKLQKMSESDLKIIANKSAEIYIEKLIISGYTEKNIDNIPSDFAEREMRNSIKVAIDS